MTDVGVWLALTKYNIFNPWSWVTWPVKSHFFGWSLFTAWWLCWKQILFGKKYQLWAPDPSICTHLAEGLMPSSYDWGAELEKGVAAVKNQTLRS